MVFVFLLLILIGMVNMAPVYSLLTAINPQLPGFLCGLFIALIIFILVLISRLPYLIGPLCNNKLFKLMLKSDEMLSSFIKKLGNLKCSVIDFLAIQISDLVIKKIVLEYKERILALDICMSVLSFALWLCYQHAFFGVMLLIMVCCIWYTHPSTKIKFIKQFYSLYFVRLLCDLIFLVMCYPVKWIDYYLIDLPLDYFYSSGKTFSKSEVFYVLHMILWHVIIPICLYCFASFWIFHGYLFLSVMYMITYVSNRYN